MEIIIKYGLMMMILGEQTLARVDPTAATTVAWFYYITWFNKDVLRQFTSHNNERTLHITTSIFPTRYFRPRPNLRNDIGPTRVMTVKGA